MEFTVSDDGARDVKCVFDGRGDGDHNNVGLVEISNVFVTQYDFFLFRSV